MTKDEALDLALEALEQGIDGQTSIQMDKAITAIKQARSAPAQEPVAFNAGVPPLYPEMKDGETISVEYTTPPAQPAPVQESVACGYDETTGNCTNNPCCYTTPPAAQRQCEGCDKIAKP